MTDDPFVVLILSIPLFLIITTIHIMHSKQTTTFTMITIKKRDIHTGERPIKRKVLLHTED